VRLTSAENFRALGDSVINHRLHALDSGLIDQTAQLRLGIERVTYLEGLALGRKFLCEFLSDGFFDDNALSGHTDLALVHERSEIRG